MRYTQTKPKIKTDLGFCKLTAWAVLNKAHENQEQGKLVLNKEPGTR